MPQSPPLPSRLLPFLVFFVLVLTLFPLLSVTTVRAAKFTATQYQPHLEIYQDYPLSPFSVPYRAYWGYRTSYYHPRYWFAGAGVGIGPGIILGVGNRWRAYPWGGGWSGPQGYSASNLYNLYCRPYYRPGRTWCYPYRPGSLWRPGQDYIAAGKPAWGRQPWMVTRGFTGRVFTLGRSNLHNRPGVPDKLPGRPAGVIQVHPAPDKAPIQTATRAPATGPAGAAWAKPWKGGGPIVMDTRRAARPSTHVIPPPANSSTQRLDSSRRTPPPANIARDRASSWYRGGPRARKYRRYWKVDPRRGRYFKRFGGRRFRGGIAAGRGYISAGRGFRGGHGRGTFRGGGFRGR
jgi:hypothetical protein